MATVHLAAASSTSRFGLPEPFGAPPYGRETIGQSADMDEEEIRFDDFVLLPRSRTLLCEARPVDIGSRAFELLHALLKTPGQLVPKETLVSQVWPTTFVDESNLRFQMTCLRKVLGAARNLIKTVPGRGYVFTGRCRGKDEASHSLSATSQQPIARLVPEPASASSVSDQPMEQTARLLLFPVQGPREPLPEQPVEGSKIAQPGTKGASAHGPASGRVSSTAMVLPVLILASSAETLSTRLLLSDAGAITIDLAGLLELLRPDKLCRIEGS